MSDSTGRTPEQVSPYCIGADPLGIPEAHARCRANGPLLVGGAAVLPPTKCACHCHTGAAFIGRRDAAPLAPGKRPA